LKIHNWVKTKDLNLKIQIKLLKHIEIINQAFQAMNIFYFLF
jgi:hypothetical protein